MANKAVDWVLDGVDSFLAWLSFSLNQSMDAYCDLETADSKTCFVGHDGSLVSVVEIHGAKGLFGQPEYEHFQSGLSVALKSAMARPGHALQVFFNYDKEGVVTLLRDILSPARATAERLGLTLDDLFDERINYLSRYCAQEKVFCVLWTTPGYLTEEQQKRLTKEKIAMIREKNLPPFKRTQNLIAAIPDLRNAHDAYVSAFISDISALNIHVDLLEVHKAAYEMRVSADPEFTDRSWRPLLPGDTMKAFKQFRDIEDNVAEIMWPNLSQQLLPRDAANIDLRTARIGDRIYGSVFIDLFPKDIKLFATLFARTVPSGVPWRMSFLIESDGLPSIRFKQMLTGVLAFSSSQNRLIADSASLLKYIQINTDDTVVRFRVAAATWAADGDIRTLRMRVSELAKAIQGWGGCEVSEMSGDPFGAVMSSVMGLSRQSQATASVAPLSNIMPLLPLTRPSSPWESGAILFRTPDGKPWPYQPGSRQQTTWIDLIYARPGSGKSVLSNTMNLALCLSGGLQRLPRIAVLDIGPSSSGLISLLQEALPQSQRHLVAYHRLRMTPDYSINPFDTQLGSRLPTPQERGFLVNFLTLLATPLGRENPYDAIPDLAGIVVDEMYKQFQDGAQPAVYSPGVEPLVDGILEEIGFVQDQRTSWWEVTDALFIAGFVHEASLAQRYAMPLLADSVSVCRNSVIEDLYGKIQTPTGETLIDAFSRMISAAVREYPILSRPTSFDLGEARIVSLDLDEVAKTGGDAADRQTAVMYMLGRYILARHYYLTEDNVQDIHEQYAEYHRARIAELREDPKRLVYDEFHRTSKAKAVRDQVIVDMREGRKWKVQIALLSQSLDDFDSVMVEFATSIYIMDAGPSQTVEKATKVFGLSDTAKQALRTRVHGPREGGATFLAQFATKEGINTQLLTCTLGPIELWAFSTTAEDALLRNQLYKRIGPREARRVLATIFPTGSAGKFIEQRMNAAKEETGLIEDISKLGVVDQLVMDILTEYSQNPNFKQLPN